MNDSIYLEDPISLMVALALAIVGMGAGLMVRIVRDGFRFGRITRQLDLMIARERFPAFVERMNHRLRELGFDAQGERGPFVQGSRIGELVQQTLAKVPKEIEFTSDESDPRQVKICLRLRYKVFALEDGGGSEYADAVLKYISNESDEMKIIQNPSVVASLGLSLGLWVWVVMFGFRFFRIEPFVQTVAAIGGTAAALGVIGIMMITIKRTEISGLPNALGAIVSGILAAVAAILWSIWR